MSEYIPSTAMLKYQAQLEAYEADRIDYEFIGPHLYSHHFQSLLIKWKLKE
jgi:hypothetical protein